MARDEEIPGKPQKALSPLDVRSLLPISPASPPSDGTVEYIGFIRPKTELRPGDLTDDELRQLHDSYMRNVWGSNYKP